MDWFYMAQVLHSPGWAHSLAYSGLLNALERNTAKRGLLTRETLWSHSRLEAFWGCFQCVLYFKIKIEHLDHGEHNMY